MKNKKFRIPLLIASIYWLPACLSLIDIINGEGTIFPMWLDAILFPGYFLGFMLGFGGGDFWALVGQLITLIILFFIGRVIYEPFRKKSTKAQQ